MLEFTYIKPIATISGVDYEIYHSEINAENSVSIRLRNDQYDFGILAIVNETIINGIIQTSADMIIETISNG